MTELSVHFAGRLLHAQQQEAANGASDLTASPAQVWRQAPTGPITAGTMPVVLLHAFPFDSAMFQAMTGWLGGLPIILIDLPGLGASPVIEPVSIRAAADAVASSLRTLRVKRAIVAGVSMGGYVTMALLRHHPELLGGALLINTKAAADTPEAKKGRLAMAKQVLAEGSVKVVVPLVDNMVSPATKASRPELVEQLRHWAKQATPEGVAWSQQAMADRVDSYDILRTTGLPIHVVAGSKDQLVPPSTTLAMLEALGNDAFFTLIEDVGHLSPVEAPRVVARLIWESYRRIGQRPK